MDNKWPAGFSRTVVLLGLVDVRVSLFFFLTGPGVFSGDGEINFVHGAEVGKTLKVGGSGCSI